MTEANKVLDAAENLVDLKAVEASLGSKFDEITKAYEQANGEIKELGATKQETVAKLEALTKSYDELYERMQTIEQKGSAVSQASAVKTFGQEFVESDSYKSLISGAARSGRMELKTAIVNATGSDQPLVGGDRLQGIYTTPNRNLTIRDVLPVSSTDSNLVEFTRENAFTNNAGPQVGGSPEAYENVTKPESAITFTLETAPVITLAHFIPVSKQVMSDSASLASHVDGRLMYGLKLKEETQLLSGTGSNHQLNGLITQATAFANESPELTNEVDIIRSAIKQAHVGEYRPDMLVLNPQDWFDIEIRKVGTSDDRYVVGNPRDMMGPTLWGLPVVVTNSISAGTFLLGTSMACEIKDRQQAAVEASYEDSTNFQKNMVTVRAEERIALCVYRTEAFISGSL